MHRNSQPGFELTSAPLRKVFAVAAVAATVALGGLVELLAQGYGVSEPLPTRTASVVVALH